MIKHSGSDFDAITGKIIYTEYLEGYVPYPTDTIFEERTYGVKEVREIYDYMNNQKSKFHNSRNETKGKIRGRPLFFVDENATQLYNKNRG